MNPAILLAIKNVAMNLVMKKVTKEIDRKFEKIVPESSTIPNDDNEVVEFTDTVEALVVSPKKVSAWVSVVTACVYFASSQGYIAPEIAELVNSILSNPETVQAIEGMVE